MAKAVRMPAVRRRTGTDAEIEGIGLSALCHRLSLCEWDVGQEECGGVQSVAEIGAAAIATSRLMNLHDLKRG